MNDPNHNPLQFPPSPFSRPTKAIGMTTQEQEAANNILEELSTADDADSISMLAEAYHGLIVAVCLRLGISSLSSEHL